jgi:PTH2 family peptidyl-tRNA hydrolase
MTHNGAKIVMLSKDASNDGEIKMKQLIIARKDLQMSPGKLAAQVSHASMAFLTTLLKKSRYKVPRTELEEISIMITLPLNIYEEWILSSFTKVICEAKNKYQLEKVITLARELGLEENKDFFLIKDNCLTELKPEEIDENGIGRTLTCIGFRPLPDDICAQLSKKYQLYK